ncbi:MAG TPA: DUF177 domain-containing protein [Cytophagales bacterium]|nr:DUF177 domain-containing protein [Cytophagales bacterium]
MAKNEFQEFDINLYQLKNKQYEYEYQVQDDFFSKVENSLIEKGDAAVRVSLVKSDHSIMVNYHITGSIKLVCDKSLEEFDEPVNVEEKVVYKFGEAYEEVSENLIVIRKDTQTINLAQSIYELIAITVPYKKVHPKLRVEQTEEEEENLQSGEIIYKSESPEGDNKDEQIDPRWEALLKLRKN